MMMKKESSIDKASIQIALVLAIAVTGSAIAAPSPTSGAASDALVTLATTGNPDPLQSELGGKIISSEKLQARAGGLLNLEKNEKLAPKALVTPDGETYAMVAPSITKDNFIFVDAKSNVMRLDVGDTEGHRKPFVVKEIIEDGGTPWYVELWYWISG
jgi:hypothetical protein